MTVTVHTASLKVWTKSILRRSIFVVITTTEVILERASRHLFRCAKASRHQASSVRPLGTFSSLAKRAVCALQQTST